MGVAPQYASSLGKTANCQTLVSLTLAGGEVPDYAGVAVVSARELDKQSGAAQARGRSGRISNSPYQARDCARRDRSCHCGRGALRLRAGGCRLWAERAVPPGPHSPQIGLGGGHSATPQGVPRQCTDDLSGCQAWPPYLANLPAKINLRTLAATIKARWICEQAHQQLKEELGLDHFEGRSWQGLHRHALMTMIGYAFLQHRRPKTARRREKKNQRAAASTNFAGRAPSHPRTHRSTTTATMSALPKMDLQRKAA